MLPIQEVNESQRELLRLATLNAGYTLFICLPDTLKDTPEHFKSRRQTSADMEHLINLKLMVDVSDDGPTAEVLSSIATANGRAYRAVALTNMGMDMFNQSDNTKVTMH